MKKGMIIRVFALIIGTTIIELADPNPALSIEVVKELYSAQYPELLNAQVISKGIENDCMRYEFKTIAGTKG